MIIQPKIRGFICTTAHPEGCEKHVQEQIEYVQSKPKVNGPKKVLVVGSSTGYGLASRIAATFSSGADTIGVCFERPASEGRTASAGWYNTAAFEAAARQAGRTAVTVVGDAFSDAIKAETIEQIKKHLGKVDMVVYSLASPRRTHPRTGESFASVLKPLGKSYSNKTINVQSGVVSDVSIEQASEDEIRQTIAVMGGEDWAMWVDALKSADVLADGVVTVAYTYIGPEVTHAIYREGTIGKAKEDLEATAHTLNDSLGGLGGRAYVSVNKALVTQSSAAIPIVPLYISMLYKVMKNRGLHEGCIEQMYRLFSDRLFAGSATPLDAEGRIRLDDLEMLPEIQAEVSSLWDQVTTDNVEQLTDLQGYRDEFLNLFGFGLDGVDYEAETDPDVPLLGASVHV